VRRIHIFLLGCIALLDSSCYHISVDIPERNSTYLNDQATQVPDLTICPPERLRIRASILGGIEGFSSEKKELIATLVDYRIMEKRSDNTEVSLTEGSTRSEAALDQTLFGRPPGVVRYSLQIKENGNWVEKDYVALPVRKEILPVTMTLNPEEYNPSNTQALGWQGTFSESDAAQASRSPLAVIDRVVVGGGHPFVQLDALDVEQNNIPVGIRKPDGSFDPSGNAIRPYPNGAWRVKPSGTPPYVARTWSDFDWKNARPITLTVYYRCGP
jgi:hypothetical protein